MSVNFDVVIADLEAKKQAMQVAIGVLRSLNGPPKSLPEVPTSTRPYKKRKSPTKKVPAPAESGSDGTMDIIRKHLGAGPMSSQELIRVTGKTASAVYTALSVMRKTNEIYTKEIDGYRKNAIREI